MKLRTRALAVAAGALLATTLAQPAQAAIGHWEADPLALPPGYSDATGWVRGTDSHGGYAGNLWLDGTSHVVTWSKGQPTLHPAPGDYPSGEVVDENSDGTVLGQAIDMFGTRTQPFLLDHGEYEMLLAPGDWASLRAVALNERGDVVADAQPNNGGARAVLLWRAEDRAHPVLITGLPFMYAADLDDDGALLVNSFPNSFIWRDGVFEQLTAPPGAAYLNAAGIRNGQVTGSYGASDWLSGEGVWWRSPGQPGVLPSSSTTFGINRYGLIVGYGTRPDPTGPLGPLSVWLNGRAMGSLPLAGFTAGYAKTVGDDGTIAGVVSDRDPSTYGGRPVVWRYSLR
ncbi:hypothetical protein AB0C38_41735 [Amycolatopsis sp. NPDC048633]|uniref:hypothetical protein n=1 Tax=Amycolatopsis sp. NPDC048633 TaxID=3157095 RepID=UPI0033EEED26